MNQVYEKLCNDLIAIDDLLQHTIANSYLDEVERSQTIVSLTQAIAHLTAAIKDLQELMIRQQRVSRPFANMPTYGDDAE